MTVIAWDGKSIAVDKRSERGEVVGTVTKLFKGKDGYALAIAGSIVKGLLLVEWFNNGRKEEDWPKFQSTDEWGWLIAAKDGECLAFGPDYLPLKNENKFCAWGSGCEFAIGAMAAGKTAYEAVAITNHHSASCGRGIDLIEF